MRRTDRLFNIIQLFRDGRLHKGADIAERMEVSLRTIYRDIETLIGSGVPITGERGVGYMMTEPVFLPPLNLTPGELEVLELGIALVQSSFGRSLSEQSQSLGDKMRAVLPRPEMLDSTRGAIAIYAPRFPQDVLDALDIVRRAILSRTMLAFAYTSLSGQESKRLVRPLEIEVWDNALTLTGWCETRANFRVFRLDRMENTTLGDHGFKPEVGKRLKDYLGQQNAKPDTVTDH
ncbi:helix-turn-helix transcriptional regulator [Oricola cellulosilytica]|uniref:YafY family transcriptional regulator n=1 Tax=Oricola cellulosilytica TaxID=1429082 RepID=A0A4R0PFB6_9HYPH|nr:YafY family protein [Oricola cellulosilytica]TCD16527.1 YafY family transcriptional regulator [Oricola cellulosilytica]